MAQNDARYIIIDIETFRNCNLDTYKVEQILILKELIENYGCILVLSSMLTESETLDYLNTLQLQAKMNELPFPQVSAMSIRDSMQFYGISPDEPVLIFDRPHGIPIAGYGMELDCKQCSRSALSKLLSIPQSSRRLHYIIDACPSVIEKAKEETWNGYLIGEMSLEKCLMSIKLGFTGESLFIDDQKFEIIDEITDEDKGKSYCQIFKTQDSNSIYFGKCSLQAIDGDYFQELKELLALKLYSFYDIKTPKSFLSYQKLSSSVIKQLEMKCAYRINDPKIHLMSESLQDLQCLKETFVQDYLNNNDNSFAVNGQSLSSLGKAIAVALLINDDLKNLGYIEKESPAKVVKISGENAFYFFEKMLMWNDFSIREELVNDFSTDLHFDVLHPEEQRDFSTACEKIFSTTDEDFQRIFEPFIHLDKRLQFLLKALLVRHDTFQHVFGPMTHSKEAENLNKNSVYNKFIYSDMISDFKTNAAFYLDVKQSYLDYIFYSSIYSAFEKNEFDLNQSKEDFIKLCEAEKDNLLIDIYQLTKDIHSGTIEKTIINWYTKNNVLSKMLTNAFKEGDYFKIFKMRYIIYLLNTSLNQITSKEVTTLFRETLIQRKQFSLLQNSIEKPFYLRGFVAACTNPSPANERKNKNRGEEYLYVVFTINIHKKYLSFVHQLPQFPEEEFLVNNNAFMIIHTISKDDTCNCVNVSCSLLDFSECQNFIQLFSSQIINDFEGNIRLNNYSNDLIILYKIFYHIRKFDDCLKILSEIPEKGDAITSMTYNIIGESCTERGEDKQALEYFHLALQFTCGENDPNPAESYKCIGKLYENRGDYKNAMQHYAIAVEVLDRVYGEVHEEIAKINLRLGFLSCKLGDNQKALHYYHTALKNFTSLFGENHQSTLACYSNIGHILCKKGEYAEALEYFQMILTRLDENSPNRAQYLNNIGEVSHKKGDYESAMEFYHSAIEKSNPLFGENQPEKARSFRGIGNVHSDKGDYDSALIYYSSALKIIRSVYGDEHQESVKYLNSFGEVYYKKGDYENALEYYRHSFKILKSTIGKKHPVCAKSYKNLGNSYSSAKQYEIALKYYQKALKLLQELFGDNNIEVAIISKSIGAVYATREQKEYDTALEYYHKALTIFLAVYGENDLHSAMSYDTIGELYQKKGEYNTAFEYYQKGLSIKQYLKKDIHPDIAVSYDLLGGLFKREKKYYQALEAYRTALAIRIAVFGENHIETAKTYSQAGMVCASMGDYEKSLENYQIALKIAKSALGENNPETENISYSIDFIRMKMSKKDA